MQYSANPTNTTTYSNYASFNPEELHHVAFFCAPRRSGKTYLMEKILEHSDLLNRYDAIIIASPTLKYKDVFPIEKKFKGVCIKLKSNFKEQIDNLMSEVEYNNMLHHEKPQEYEPYHTLFILDDIIDSKIAAFNNNNNVTDLIAERGRHLNTSLWLSTQYMSAASPSVRRNASYIFLWAPKNFADIERTLQEYVPKEARKEFLSLITRAFVRKFAFVMINNNTDNVRYYKLRFFRGFTEHLFSFHTDDYKLVSLEKGSNKPNDNEDEDEDDNDTEEEREEAVEEDMM